MSASIVTEPSGKAAGKTTQAATAGSLGGSGLGVLVAYLMVKSGFETDPETAVLVGGVIASLVGGVVAYFMGRRTPTDQVRTVTTFTGVDAVDPAIEADREAAAAGADPDYVPSHRA